MAVSSALQEMRMFSSFLRQGLSGWKLKHDINNSAYIVSGVRFYRGSNRDTRRRERNLRAKLKKREPEEPMVFDKKEFFRQNYDKELFSFKSRLGLKFHDEKILLAAFTHESHEDDHVGDDNDNNKTLQSRENNTKLSLLGLTATSLYIVDHLCTTYPSLPRLGVRCFHDFLVGRSNIVKLCNQISLPDLIRLEHDLDDLHKEKHLDYRKEDVICDTFFALVGAIYVDQGPVEARRFVEDFVIAQLQGEELHKILHFDYPEKVLENIFTIQGKEKPVARVIQETGITSPVPVYVVGVFSGDDMIAEASSYTVIRAKNEALKAALMKHCQEGMLLPFPNERNQADRVSQ
ncbi:ribonuclease 3-like [Montipora capricornis]|uniref:ribonuclease 3-like n=1 Tax=Montipora capricornis TaxID=246305 RepID=UPI0035F20442